jgi:hypothetical protein
MLPGCAVPWSAAIGLPIPFAAGAPPSLAFCAALPTVRPARLTRLPIPENRLPTVSTGLVIRSPATLIGCVAALPSAEANASDLLTLSSWAKAGISDTRTPSISRPVACQLPYFELMVKRGIGPSQVTMGSTWKSGPASSAAGASALARVSGCS